jgi:hypothetical protein
MRNHQPFGLRYRRLAPLVPLRVVVSAWLVRRRRVVAPAGESLSFVAPNESNQSKGALHSSQLRGYKVRPMRRHATARGRTPAAIGNRADAKRGVDGDVAKQRPYCSWAPCEPSRSAGLCRARVSAHQQLTSGGCSSAVSEANVASSARPAKTEHRREVAPRATGEQGALSFGSFSLGKQRKGTALSGAHPDADEQVRQKYPRDSGTSGARLRYLSPSGWMRATVGRNRARATT